MQRIYLKGDSRMQIEISDWRFLAKELRNFGISSTRTSVVRGYKKSDFFDAWNRYLPQKAVTPVTPVTSHTRTSDANDANDAFSEVGQQTNQKYAQTIQ